MPETRLLYDDIHTPQQNIAWLLGETEVTSRSLSRELIISITTISRISTTEVTRTHDILLDPSALRNGHVIHRQGDESVRRYMMSTGAPSEAERLLSYPRTKHSQLGGELLQPEIPAELLQGARDFPGPIRVAVNRPRQVCLRQFFQEIVKRCQHHPTRFAGEIEMDRMTELSGHAWHR